MSSSDPDPAGLVQPGYGHQHHHPHYHHQHHQHQHHARPLPSKDASFPGRAATALPTICRQPSTITLHPGAGQAGQPRKVPRALVRDGLIYLAGTAVQIIANAVHIACAPALDKFIRDVAKNSRTTSSVLRVALYYLVAAKPNLVPATATATAKTQTTFRDSRELFLAALILAFKYLHDKTFSSRGWAKITSFEPGRINRCEVALLDCLGWRLHVPVALFNRWDGFISDYHNELIPCLLADPASTAALAFVTEWRMAVLTVDPRSDEPAPTPTAALKRTAALPPGASPVESVLPSPISPAGGALPEQSPVFGSAEADLSLSTSSLSSSSSSSSSFTSSLSTSSSSSQSSQSSASSGLSDPCYFPEHPKPVVCASLSETPELLVSALDRAQPPLASVSGSDEGASRKRRLSSPEQTGRHIAPHGPYGPVLAQPVLPAHFYPPSLHREHALAAPLVQHANPPHNYAHHHHHYHNHHNHHNHHKLPPPTPLLYQAVQPPQMGWAADGRRTVLGPIGVNMNRMGPVPGPAMPHCYVPGQMYLRPSY